jgi:hypothetical protein
VRSVTTRSAEFDIESYELLAALYDIEDDVHTCGQPLSESSSWEADELNPDRSIVYRAAAPGRCQACTVLNRQQKVFAEEHDGKHDSAHLWSVDRVELPT